MKSEWNRVQVGVLCSRVCSGGTPKSTNSEYYGGNIPWLNTREVNFNRISQTEGKITQAGFDNSSAKWVKENCVIVAMYGATAGRCAITRIPLTTNQACCNLEIDDTKADYRFVYYALKNEYVRLSAAANGGAQQNLNAQQVKEFDIPYPCLPIQRKIATILSALDDKIETNNAICRNLEEQIKLIFKDTYASKVKDSSAGIEDVTLADVCSAITKGTTPSTLGHRFENEGVNFVKAESITNCHRIEKNKISFISLETHNKLKRSQVEEGDILFSIAGTLGRFTIADNHILPTNTNQAVAIIRANKEKVAPEYLYSLFIAGWHDEYCKKNVQQAVQANLSLGIIKSLPIFLLLGRDMNDYLSKITPLITMMKKLERESNCLSSLRDVILPKLMNGEFV